ncbi:MAG: UDP-glucose/GDP-mannose dehydrogenase family protein [Alphaproteobacteria bacterium]|nr:UDP-glucose/GDP-mannose dehydrogenase family protein [Alphaproteobacteria bacterium]
MTPTVGFAGLTHLGLVSAIGTASKGFSVVGYDPDRKRVDDIRAGRLPVVEPGLDELLRTNGPPLAWSADIAALSGCDLVYIASDVPTDDHGQSNLEPIDELVAQVGPALKPDALLIVLCQVPPGYTRRLAFPLDRRFYQVETLVFGRAVERATQPERFIVGCADPERPLPAKYREVLSAFGCPILPMRYESAELCKISINCCLVASVTVANTLSELSERIGADWHEIAPALRLDRRIGQFSYLAPGLGIAGGNLERDLATVLRFANEVGSEATLIESFVRNSRHRRDWALRTLHDRLLRHKVDARLGILGLAYKENTHSTKNSPSLALIQALQPWPIRVYDPVVPATAASHPRAEAAADAVSVGDGADAIIIMTPWPDFRKIDPAALARRMRGRLLVDPFKILDPKACRAAGLDHAVLGMPVA